MPSGKEITLEVKNQIIEYYKTNIVSLQNISDKFNICVPTIAKILKNTPRHLRNQVRNPNMVENYFEIIDNEYKAYYLGWMLTDGNVFSFKDKPNYGNIQAKISLYIKEEDKYILDILKNELKTNTLITNDNKGCYVFKLHSNKMFEDLQKYGIVPNKSSLTYLPKIRNDLMCHFIRGIFDGDGCAYIKNCRGTKRNNYYHSFSFCGSHTLMEDLSIYLYENLNLKILPNVYDYKNRNLSEFKIVNLKDIIKFCNYIYKNSTICLNRKYSKYIQLKKDFDLEQDNTELT